MELVTADDQLIVISNLDVDLLESEATVLLDDDGMSAQTQGTLFSRIPFADFQDSEMVLLCLNPLFHPKLSPKLL